MRSTVFFPVLELLDDKAVPSLINPVLAIPPDIVPDRPPQPPPLVPDFGPLFVTWSPNGTIITYTNTTTGTSGTQTPDGVFVTNWNSSIIQLVPNDPIIVNAPAGPHP